MVCEIMIKIIIMIIIHQTSSNAWEHSAIPNVQCRRRPSSQAWVGNCCEPILSPVIIHSSISRRILSRWYRYHTVIKIISADHYEQLQHESPSHTSNATFACWTSLPPSHICLFLILVTYLHIFPIRLSLRRRSTTLSPLCVRRTSNRLVLAGPPIIFRPYDYHDFHVLPSYWILASPPIIMAMLKKEICQRNTNHPLCLDLKTSILCTSAITFFCRSPSYYSPGMYPPPPPMSRPVALVRPS